MNLHKITDSYSEAKPLHNENYKIIARHYEDLQDQINTLRSIIYNTRTGEEWVLKGKQDPIYLKAKARMKAKQETQALRDREYLLNFLTNLVIEIARITEPFADRNKLVRSIVGAINEVKGEEEWTSKVNPIR